ncbi:unnamed protein product [Hymenolepis diminuta]|uniref:Uncharacterized protein n=1 Tax=Hymenolepis diminuta TaxID=6216 RepID=A0A564Y753_HYMDI|nr:unnamed protein product [Hymenolepis diminuta]
MLILWRTSSSSRLPYRRPHCQNCNDNGHKEGFYRGRNLTTRTRGVSETPVEDPSTQFDSTICQMLFQSIDYSAKEISRRVRIIHPQSRI